ncbi:hypothetical protein RHMOL_Rhmol10G0271900 [Rhododendron molle]|uniref:Uncharacterized protein n=1 Tax=Rhododendron molle TaxID=49168 RepID=A0ACC0M6G8_RHOML|nr:hypothetical protein RHMOL_Rhmol10G0271900 [Rhododendron molle]
MSESGFSGRVESWKPLKVLVLLLQELYFQLVVYSLFVGFSSTFPQKRNWVLLKRRQTLVGIAQRGGKIVPKSVLPSGFHFKVKFKFKMSVAFIWVVSPNSEVSNCFGFLESAREGNRLFDSSRYISRDRSLICHSKFKRGNKKNWKYSSSNADLSYSYSGKKGKSPIVSSLVANPAGEMATSSEQKVYDVVLKQAALVKKQLKNAEDYDVKPDIVLPGTLSLLSEAYDRCGEVCAENAADDSGEAKSYMGNICQFIYPNDVYCMMSIAKISLFDFLFLVVVLVHKVWCRRTDELVDGPNASHITPKALDRWESRLEDIFRGRPFDMLDAALSDTVTRFPVDIQPFKDMIEGMRMDLRKSRYKNFDELYLYCYYVAGTVGLMSVPIMGIAPETQATTESVYNAALALGIANQLTNILRDVGEDARRGRVYLPQDELAQAGLSDEDIFAGKVTDKWRSFMKNQIKRARLFFDEAEKGVTELNSASRWPVWASLLLYRQILDEIEANDYNNFTRRAYVSKPKKVLALPVAYAKSLVSPSRTSSLIQA